MSKSHKMKTGVRTVRIEIDGDENGQKECVRLMMASREGNSREMSLSIYAGNTTLRVGHTMLPEQHHDRLMSDNRRSKIKSEKTPKGKLETL